MSFRSYAFQNASCRAATLIGLVALAALGGCGGGSSGPNTPSAGVSSINVAVTRYGAAALITIVGTGLDSTLGVSSTGCTGMTLLTSGATTSSSTTAYYNCTVSGQTASSVIVTSNGTQIGSQPFSVAQPQVTMNVTNDGGNVNGNMVITLTPDLTPNTVNNFLAYVNAGFYNGTIFSRVVNTGTFQIAQGGGYGPTVNNQLTTPLTPLYPGIAVETGGGNNVPYSLAMANEGPNYPDSTANQFFFNITDNSTALDGGYSVFGNLLDNNSQAVLTSIANAPASCTAPNANGDGTTDCLPLPDVVINSATQTQ